MAVLRSCVIYSSLLITTWRPLAGPPPHPTRPTALPTNTSGKGTKSESGSSGTPTAFCVLLRASHLTLSPLPLAGGREEGKGSEEMTALVRPSSRPNISAPMALYVLSRGSFALYVSDHRPPAQLPRRVQRISPRPTNTQCGRRRWNETELRTRQLSARRMRLRHRAT